MAHPTDALHFREVFGRHMRRPEAGTEQAFFVAPYHQDWKTREFEDMIEAVRIQVSECVDYGETFYVSREITEILLRHTEQLRQRRIMHFEADDFPSLAGMVYFDGPVPLPTVLNETRTQPLVAVIWGQMATRATEDYPPVRMPNDPTRVIGKIMYSVTEATELQRRTSSYPFKWRLRHWMPVSYDQRMDPQNMHVNDPPDDEMMAELGDMRLAMTPEERARDHTDTQDSTSIIMCLMKVWCAFLKTEILGKTNWDVDRAHKKMMGREGRPLPQVRIITLRRYAKTSNEVLGNIVNWSHRWKVRGHYRMQRVGPGRAMFQRVWVSECIKGPPHLPLDERDTVQAVTR